MQRIVFDFDIVSPYAYLAFERLPRALDGFSYWVEYRPLLFAGLLKHWGNVGPAEIDPKRDWLFRQCAWIAARDGTPFEKPAQHPFNPLFLLRLLLASVPRGQHPNRLAVERVMRHVWARGGADASDPAALAALVTEIDPVRDPAGDEVKLELRERTDAAIQRGVFGVPTFQLDDGRIFWGQDSIPMLVDALREHVGAA